MFDSPAFWNRYKPAVSTHVFANRRELVSFPHWQRPTAASILLLLGKNWRCYLTSSPFHSLLYHHRFCLTLMVSGNFLNHSFLILTLFRRFFVITLPSIQRLFLSLPWLVLKQNRERWASGCDCVRQNLSIKLFHLGYSKVCVDFEIKLEVSHLGGMILPFFIVWKQSYFW